MIEFTNKLQELEYAKKAVSCCLNSCKCLVDFHGLVYWAEVVERLRKEITEEL